MKIDRYADVKYVSISFIRRVWSEVTKEPSSSIRELAKRLNTETGRVHAALTALDQSGYVLNCGARARRIIVPFYEVRPC